MFIELTTACDSGPRSARRPSLFECIRCGCMRLLQSSGWQRRLAHWGLGYPVPQLFERHAPTEAKRLHSAQGLAHRSRIRHPALLALLLVDGAANVVERLLLHIEGALDGVQILGRHRAQRTQERSTTHCLRCQRRTAATMNRDSHARVRYEAQPHYSRTVADAEANLIAALRQRREVAMSTCARANMRDCSAACKNWSRNWRQWAAMAKPRSARPPVPAPAWY